MKASNKRIERTQFLLYTLNQKNMSITSAITTREKQVLILLAEGLTAKEVAGVLHLSYYTIISHKKSLFEKLNAVNCFQLGVIAERLGLLSNTKSCHSTELISNPISEVA